MENLNKFVTEMRVSNSKKHKEAVIKAWNDRGELPEVLKSIMDPGITYGVSTDNMDKNKDLVNTGAEYTDLSGLLSDLADRKLTGHDALAACIEFRDSNSEYRDLINDVFDKDLKMGCTEGTFNRVIPGYIPVFDVALADKYTEKIKLDDSWTVMRKLDGVRCVAIVGSNEVKFFSRKGKEFLTLGKVAEDILKIFKEGDVIDGEVCLVDADGKENFQGIMKEIRKKDHTIPNPKYIMFDLLTKDEFYGKLKSQGYINRLHKLVDTIHSQTHMLGLEVPATLTCVEAVNWSEQHMTMMEQQAAKDGWEGLMLRADVPYESGRSKDLLKVKKFHDAEFVVTGVESSEINLVENGVARKVPGIGALFIKHKDNKVGVGSGLTLEQRMMWEANPSLIIGKTITVKYFEETVDEHGKPSLRFPVLKVVHGDEREV